MKKSLTFSLLASAAVLIAACVPSPSDFETTPVQVSTSKGVVTCQLYRLDRVDWDRAIDFPATKMTVPEADQICRDEGLRIKNS
ncbi:MULTISPECIES: hypothetical protein [unclassified Ruegeria]|uniref:hypothetical protein n=1 Tax=unclassified Ruegeria TaxID=2625375 RepID=UPI001487CBE3|nr:MULTISPECIES: hypothetical protein [unclassified Ruegeria]